ncbi:hypothetical protein ACFXJ8_25985 [Nonomuraea sp. NPDC059194]|uniref:hypothetical protein n=1 Tax=Nonomuraea sp. NPDC059194 TaxID=3346764 RepID=UPI00369EB4B1
MADRTVTTRLKLAVADWTAGKNTVKRDLKDLNRQFADSAGAASGFRKKLEDAVKKLPKIEIDANSSAAEVKVAELRSDLEKLAAKRVGIDIDAGDALAEMARLQAELKAVEAGASFEVRASIGEALKDLAAVDAEVSRLRGQRTRITVDADTREALAGIGKVSAGLAGLSVGIPTVASLGAAAVTMGGAFMTAGVGVTAFGTVATATLTRVQEAVEKQDYSKLSPEEFELAQHWQEFSDVYLDWQRSLNPQVIPAISTGLGLMGSTLPKISPLVAGTANSFTTLGREAQTALNGPFWNEFLTNIGVAGPQAVLGFGRSFGNIAGGVAGVINAFLPWQGTVVGGLEDATAKFREWGQSLDQNPQFKEFMAYVQAHAPEVWQLIKNVAAALLNVGEAVLPLGTGSMAGLNLLAQIVADMDPAILTAVAGGLVAIKLAQAGMQVASFWGDLRDRIGDIGSRVDGAKGKLSSFAGLLAGGGPWGVALAAGVTAIGLFASAHAEAEQYVRDLASTLDKQTGAITADTRAKVINKLETEGYLKSASQIGLNLKTVTDAALGSAPAIAEFNRQLAAAAEAQGVAGHRAVDLGGKTVYLNEQFGGLALAVNGAGGELRDSVEVHKRNAEAMGQAGTAANTSGSEMATMGTKASTAAGSIDTLRASLGQLIGVTTNAMTAEIGYKQALDDAASAAKTNGEEISTNTQKGRDNRQALISLAQAANGYRDALVAQGTPMAEVEAKLGTQRAAFVKVAESMGFSKKEAGELATKLGLIPGNVKTDVKTPGGKEALALIKEYERKLNALDGKTVTTAVNQVITYSRRQIIEKNRERGAIDRYETGGIRAFASGGMTTGPRPGPHIATRPTILYGEGRDAEAFIPYDKAFRKRAIGLLGQVADDFGLKLFNREAEEQAVALTGGLREANYGISTTLASATTMLDQTLGSAGSLTGAIVGVGEVGQDLTAGWVEGSGALGDAVTDMGTAVSESGSKVSAALDALGLTVKDLAAVLDQAASRSGSGGKAGTSKRKGSPPPVQTGDAMGPTDAEIRARMKKKPPPGYVGDAAGPSDAEIRRRMAAKAMQVPGGSLKEVAFASGGFIAAPTRALIGEDGPEVVIPLGRRYRDEALKLLSDTASMLGARHTLTRSSSPTVVPGGQLRDAYAGGMPGVSASVNTSRVSAPQQMSPQMALAQAFSRTAEKAAAGGQSGGGRGGSLVHVENLQVRERADADLVASYLSARIDSKGF